MSKRIKLIVKAGSILFLVMCIAAGVYLGWPKQNFTLPNGRRVTVERITWRPENRFPKNATAPFVDLVNRACEKLKLPQFDNPYYDYGPSQSGAIWISAEHPDDLGKLELRLAQGVVESQPLPYFVPSVPGNPKSHVNAFLIGPVPQDGSPLILRIYCREPARGPKQLIGEMQIQPVVSPNPQRQPKRFEAATGTNDTLLVEVDNWQIPATTPPSNVLDPSLIRLRIREKAIPSVLATNWAIASITMEDASGDSLAQHVDGRDHTNGVLQAGMSPVWIDGSPWVLRIGLVRTKDFPASNHVHFGPLYPSTALSPNPGMVTNVFGRLFTARLDLGRPDDPPVAEVTNWQASLLVKSSGSYRDEPHHVRWVSLTDQRGTNYGFSRYAWGGDLYRFRPNRETNFIDGTVTSAEAVISWEPIHFVEVVATPRAATNFADWPSRAEPKPVPSAAQ
jgi:hypothetical protein